jgi:putative membrane protein
VPLVLAQISNSHRGFLPTRGSFMLDFVFLAMFGIIAMLAVSIYLVRSRRRYELHKRIQIALGLILLVAVTAFEIDLNFIVQDWRPLAEPSPYFASGMVDYSLWIHLCFAVPTPLLWIFVIVQGLRKIPQPAGPCAYSRRHIFWARLAAAGMLLTAITGWIFYWLAFVAT